MCLITHFLLPHFKGPCVSKWWHTSVSYLHTCSPHLTCKPRPLGLLWLAAARGSVISCLLITELSSHENSLCVSSHATLLYIQEVSVSNSKMNTLSFLVSQVCLLFPVSHRSPTATRFWGGWGRRWWPRSQWCGWQGWRPRRTSAWSRTRNISSPPDGQRVRGR